METRKNDLKYLLGIIIAPLLLMLTLSYVMGTIMIDVPRTIFEIIPIKLRDIDMFSKIWFKTLLVFLVLFFFYRKGVKGKVFVEGVRGCYPIFVYRIARTMGYRTVSLAHMPIPMQFNVLNIHLFDEYIPRKEDVDVEDINYKVFQQEGSGKELNIVILDTYEELVSDLPNEVREYKTVVIKRDGNASERGKRVHSDKMLDAVRKIKNDNSDIKEFNLFLYINPYSTIKMYKDVFNTLTDGYTLNIYYTDMESHAFISKKETIRC